MIRKSTYMVSFKRVIGWCEITRQYKENHLGVGGRKQVIVIKFIPYICVKDQDMIVSENRDLIFIIFQSLLIIGGIAKVKLRPFMDEAFFIFMKTKRITYDTCITTATWQYRAKR